MTTNTLNPLVVPNRSRQRGLQTLGRHALLSALGISFFIPWLWMITTSLKSKEQLLLWPPVWIPMPPVWQNYVDALTKAGMQIYILNTLIIAVACVVGTVLSNTLVAYGFSRIRWPGRDLVFVGVLATMMLPFHVRMIPLYVVFSKLGWINTYLPLTVPSFFASAWFIFLLRQFFLGIPLDLTDAAEIDGCSEFGILWLIIVPLAKPAIAVVALFQFINSWNEYLQALIYLYEERLYTISLGLAGLRDSYGMSDFSLIMAATTITTLPIVIIFFFAQRTFIQGITFTGMKG